jgi:transcriptional regulator
MYDLPYFKEDDMQVIREFIESHPFAFLMAANAQGLPQATQIPVFLEEDVDKKVLRGHIMRNTEHHKALLENPNVLVVFTGPHCYVSATWYTNPSQGSTWNYMSVHARGKIRFLDEQALIDVLRKTSLYFENNNTDAPTIYDNLPPAYTQRMIKAIVPFEIEILQMEHVFKLSQNRDKKSYLNIIRKLREQDGDAQRIADEMEKRTEQLFPTDQEWNPNKFMS